MTLSHLPCPDLDEEIYIKFNFQERPEENEEEFKVTKNEFIFIRERELNRVFPKVDFLRL